MCKLKGTSHGKILGRQKIDFKNSKREGWAQPLGAGAGGGDTNKEAKIFCGIYTMAKNHPTEVKSTKETWAKKCDGFIAFSTVDDPNIPRFVYVCVHLYVYIYLYVYLYVYV